MKLMKWIDPTNGNGSKILHIKVDETGYKPYTAFPHLKQPDTVVPGLGVASKGFRTAQVLLKMGFVYEPSDDNQ